MRLVDRVAELERVHKEEILPAIKHGNEQRELMKQDVSKILAVVTGAEKVGSVVVRYGPKVITFGAGIMTAAGLGNPEVLKFITSFFA